MTIIYLASALFVILFIAAMAQFVISAADRRQIVAGALQGTVKQEPPGSRFDRLSRRFNATRFGRYLIRPAPDSERVVANARSDIQTAARQRIVAKRLRFAITCSHKGFPSPEECSLYCRIGLC